MLTWTANNGQEYILQHRNVVLEIHCNMSKMIGIISAFVPLLQCRQMSWSENDHRQHVECSSNKIEVNIVNQIFGNDFRKCFCKM